MALSTDQYKQIAVQAAHHFGIPVQPFLRQLNQESGFQPGLTSPAGARWIGQFIPSTAKEYGVHDDVSSIWGAAHYMANNLKAYGSMERALSAYNSGRPDAYKDPHFAGGQTYNYVRSIMGGQDIAVPGVSLPVRAGAPSVPRAAGAAVAAVPDQSLQGAATAAQQAAAQARDIRQQAIGNLRGIAEGNSPVEALTHLASYVTSLPHISALPPAAAAVPSSIMPSGAAPATPMPKTGAWKSWVSLSPSADRPGVHTSPVVLNFVARIAALAKQKLAIGTGTNHNEYVLGTNRVSQHWTGHAADIPATGDALTRLGQEALIAAGMPRAKALQQTGGLFNIGRYQIIFNSMEGGNHFNHLHVGVA